MAQIVFGLGTSHTPMLLADPTDLPRYEENDRRLSLLDCDGQKATFDMMLAAAGGRYEKDVTAEALTSRHSAAREAIARLSDALAGAALDVLIVIGDDQREMLRGTDIPSLLVYDRPTIRSQRPPHASGRPEWTQPASGRYYADQPTDYPVAQDLARHLIGHLGQQGFAVAPAPFDTDTVPMGHAFAFIQSQVMVDPVIPIVPVLLNALYPPNQPTPAQCLAIGEGIGRAVAAFPNNSRIGIAASGGLSHFVVDEGLDGAVVRALADRDDAALADLPLHKLNSGNAEIRNWICAAGALKALRVQDIAYIAGYRTRAGTGVGLGFATWR
jgi:catalytic LigB subunit of aromatic ring-opening dioxygenase